MKYCIAVIETNKTESVCAYLYERTEICHFEGGFPVYLEILTLSFPRKRKRNMKHLLTSNPAVAIYILDIDLNIFPFCFN